MNMLVATCRAELESVEAAYAEGRRGQLEACQAEMSQLFESRAKAEQDFTDRYLAAVESYQKQLFDLQVSDAQDFNSLKVNLENERQTLEQHMETMLATYQLNIEKLDYNYRVLVERDHENTVTINQQKRKIARQRDLLTNLKTKCAVLRCTLAQSLRLSCSPARPPPRPRIEEAAPCSAQPVGTRHLRCRCCRRRCRPRVQTATPAGTP